MTLRPIVLALMTTGALFATQQALAQSAQDQAKTKAQQAAAEHAGHSAQEHARATGTTQDDKRSDQGKTDRVPRLKSENSGDGVEEEEDDI